MLEVPDYSKIFDKYYDVLRDKIIRYAKGNLEGVSKHFTEKYNHDDPNCDIEESIQDFMANISNIPPKMHSERTALEDDEVGDDEEEAWECGFWGDCDEEWDYLMNDLIHKIVEEEKLATHDKP